MGWGKYFNALITNCFGDKLPRDHKNIHAKNYISKCSSFWSTVKRMSKKVAAKHFVQHFIYKKFNIATISVAVDAQVVLSWLLTERVKIKNVFAANRIKDIQVMLGELKTTHNLNVNFKYVPTRENPADLLTRGLTLAAFKQDLDFWLKGPTWLQGDSVKWPNSNLECLKGG